MAPNDIYAAQPQAVFVNISAGSFVLEDREAGVTVALHPRGDGTHVASAVALLSIPAASEWAAQPDNHANRKTRLVAAAEFFGKEFHEWAGVGDSVEAEINRTAQEACQAAAMVY